jgi:hypothetical protein
VFSRFLAVPHGLLVLPQDQGHHLARLPVYEDQNPVESSLLLKLWQGLIVDVA